MPSLKKLGELSAPEGRGLLLALALLPATGLALRVGGLRLAWRALGLDTPSPVRRGTLDARQLARLVAAASRWGPFRCSCVGRSLVLQAMLKRHGVESQLRLGVRKDGMRLAAHAWVEHQGRPLIDAADVGENFAPFEPISPDHRP